LIGCEDGAGVAAVALFGHSFGVADYVINVSSVEGRKYSRILIWAAVKALKERGVTLLNLGGGVRPGDALEAFKRRFGGSAADVRVLMQVCDTGKYRQLCSRYCESGNFASHYFPPYWRPGSIGGKQE
jgi:hypothetical protein